MRSFPYVDTFIRNVAAKRHAVAEHVFRERPKFCVAFKPKMILVRGSSGEVRSEYFGPSDGDEVGAELEFLRREIDAAYRILLDPSSHRPPMNPRVAA